MYLIRAKSHFVFLLSVSGVPSHKTLKITMCNLNKQSKLYSQGMMPVYRVVPGKIKWERVRDRPTYEVNRLVGISLLI